MANSPSSTSGRRNRPGCMSGLAHLFDFNQALAGRKLLTDKKYGAGLESPRSSPNRNMEQFKVNTNGRGHNEFGKSASVSRRSAEVPMKALIAEEISHETGRWAEPKGQAPNVVARLMGLDALPSDRSSEQNIQIGEFENSMKKMPLDKHQPSKLPGHSSSRSYKSAGPPTRSVSDLSSSRRSNWEGHTSNFESLSSQSHLHEQSSRRVLDSWKDWKSEDYARMQALDDLDMQLAAKQMLIKKKLTEAKLGLLSKHSGPQEKLYESKEFMDAIDFLQANKDFFARFLEQPDSLLAKHLRNDDERPSPARREGLGKYTKRHSLGTLNNGLTTQNWSKEPPDLHKSSNRTSGKNIQVDERLSVHGTSLHASSMRAQHKHTKGSDSVSSNGECQQAPTKIVVLKPGPGKVRNLMSLSQNSPRSPREFFDALEVIKENSMDVLLDLKCKLQQEDARGHPRKTWTAANEHSMPLRDPREIAREIARQVRETVAKDMRANMEKGTVNGTGLGRKMEPSEIVDDEIDEVNASHKGIGMVLGRGQAKKALFALSNQDLDRKSVPEREGESRRSLDHPVVEGSDVSLMDPISLRRYDHHGGRGFHPHKQRASRVDGIYSSQNSSAVETDMDCDTDSCTHSLCESDADAYARTGNATCITLLRSRSVPASCSTFHEGVEEVDRGMGKHNFFVVGEGKAMDSNRSFDAGIHQLGALRHSSSSRKRLGVKDNLSKSRPYVKEPEEIVIPCQEMPTQKFHRDACSEHEKVQHQIDDTGPILDSDSSISSVDNFLTLEAALLSGDTDGGQLLAQSTPLMTAIEQTMPKNPKFSTKSKENKSDFTNLDRKLQSPAGSPNKFIAVEPMAADDREAIKDPTEQPSPVSVLDAHFHEEPASPVDFTEASSGLQDLQARIQLLKFVDQEAVSIQEEYQEEDCEVTDDNPSANNHHHSNDIMDCSSQHVEDASLILEETECLPRGEPELIYIKDLLAASGFTLGSAAFLMPWHSPIQPLAACVFDRVENRYRCHENGCAAKEEGGLVRQTRLLLFDIVNEVLVEVLSPHVNCHTWWKASHAPSSTMPRGMDLVGQVWSRVCKLFLSQSEAQDTLGSLVAEDLANKDEWRHLTIDIEIILLEVEEAIWSDLVEETLHYVGTNLL